MGWKCPDAGATDCARAVPSSERNVGVTANAALAAAMDRLLSDRDLRERLAAPAREVFNRFGEESFFARWEAVLADADPDRAPFADLVAGASQ